MDNKALIRASALLGEARSLLEGYRDRKQELFDEKSEKWQESDPGQALANKIVAVDEIVATLEQVERDINSQQEEK